MTDTVTAPGPAVSVDLLDSLPDGFRGLDSDGVVDLIVDQRAAADRAEALLLAGVVHYVDLHPVVGAHDEPAMDVLPTSGPAGMLPPTLMPVSSPGVPEVTEDAAAALAAALGISHGSVCALIGDSLQLTYRLPRLWGLVQAGRLQAWKARKVAQHTRQLSPGAVGFVDRHLAVTAVHNRVPAHLGAVTHQALLRCDPEIAEGHEEAALEDRHVSFSYGQATVPCASAELTATLDVLDALDLDHRISDLAGHLGRLGDTSPVGVRRAHALGLLANPQHALPLFNAGTGPVPSRAADDGGSARAAAAADGPVGAGMVPWRDRLNTVRATLYLHVTAADLADAAGERGCSGQVETLGPATLRLLGDWLRRASRVTIRPVLDPTRPDTVDVHDPPGWMREAVVLRDGQCVFPGCRIDARSCDLDHTTPYQPITDGGPPRHTSTGNLAALCRRHHRLKTFTAWHYQRLPDGTYHWTSPQRRTYVVTPEAKHPPPPALE